MKISKARLLVIIKEIAERTIVEADEFDDLMSTDLKIPVYYVWDSSYNNLDDGTLTIHSFEEDIQVDEITDISLGGFQDYLAEVGCPEHIVSEIEPSAAEAMDDIVANLVANDTEDEDEVTDEDDYDSGDCKVTIWVYPPNLKRSAEGGGSINEWTYGMATSD